MATTITSAASVLLQQQINNTPKTALGKPTTVARAANIPKVGLNAPALGRPVGQASRIEEFKQRLVSSSGDAIISKLIQIALHDGNPGQMSALKMCVDRVLPLSHFEKSLANGGQSPQISINISGFTPTSTVVSSDDIIDVTDISSHHE